MPSPKVPLTVTPTINSVIHKAGPRWLNQPAKPIPSRLKPAAVKVHADPSTNVRPRCRRAKAKSATRRS